MAGRTYQLPQELQSYSTRLNGKGPATGFFNQQLRTKLPEVHTDVRDPAKIQETNQKAKGKMKQYTPP